MSLLHRTAVPLALAVSLSACAGNTPTIGYAYVSDNYGPYLLGYAAAKGGMPTEVTGNPFTAPKGSLDQEVSESLTNNHFGPEVEFFTSPTPDADSAYRVVVLFNPAPHANGAKLCSSDERPQAAEGQGLGVLASFCTTDQRINSASGSIRGAAGPDDPVFKRLMAQVALQLFPPQTQNRNDRDGQFF